MHITGYLTLYMNAQMKFDPFYLCEYIITMYC